MSEPVAGNISDKLGVTLGVPQGFILLQSLFYIYVNYITKDVSKPWDAYTKYFKLSVQQSTEGVHKFEINVILLLKRVAHGIFN